jgi:hypothetical protein
MKALIMILAAMMLRPTGNELIEVKLDMQEEVKSCEMYLIVDDEYIPLHNPEIKGSQITVYIKEYKDYLLVINHKPVTITIDAYEIVDERDISISMNGEYVFKNGVLNLIFDKYAEK